MKEEIRRGRHAYKCKAISTHNRYPGEMFTHAKIPCTHTFILGRALRKQVMESKLDQVKISINLLNSFKCYHIYSLFLMGTLRRIEMHYIYDLYAYRETEYRRTERKTISHELFALFSQQSRATKVSKDIIHTQYENVTEGKLNF